MNQNPSLCIPRVFPNISQSRIQNIFNDLKIGEIERIDIVPKTEKFNRVFIHFRRWHNQEVKERILNGKDIKIIYDDPWFWKVSMYRTNPTREPRHNNEQNTRPYKGSKPYTKIINQNQHQNPK